MLITINPIDLILASAFSLVLSSSVCDNERYVTICRWPYEDEHFLLEK